MLNALNSEVRRRTAVLFGSSLLISAGLGLSHAAENQNPRAVEKKPRMLILYFSQPEAAGAARELTDEEENSTVTAENRLWGNNEWLAELIRRETGADIVRITPASPYPTEHAELIDFAKKEQITGALPALSAETLEALKHVGEYDLIYLGYPIWWYTFPRILISVLTGIDLSGKTVAPFVAHGGSGLADTEEVIKKMHPNVRLLDGFEIYRSRMEEAERRIPAWVKKVSAEYREDK